MEKYQNCKEFIPLRAFLASLFFIISSTALADNVHYLTGKINEINIDKNFCSMTVIHNGNTSWLNIENRPICDFAQRAKDFNTFVDFKYKLRNGYFSAENRNEIISVKHSFRNSSWFNGDKSRDNQSYSLAGNIENVYYHKNGRCYIAINDNKKTNKDMFPDKYNKTFHETNNIKICNLADSAFYFGLKVKMNAIVDRTENDYANDIYSLTIEESCPK